MTATATRRSLRSSAVGSDLPDPVRRRRPWLAAAAVLAFLLVWLVVSSGLERVSQRTQVWSLAVDVSRGETVDASQLTPTEIAASSTNRLVASTTVARDQLVGGIWAADLPAGTLLSEALVQDRLEIAPDQALVGLSLAPGRWPTPALRAGDTVAIVHAAGDAGAATVLVARASVESVTSLGDAAGATRLVTVAVPAADLVEVARAAAANEVTLAVVP